MKSWKKFLGLVMATACLATLVACSKDEEEDSDSPLADGSTIVSGTPNNAGGGTGGSTTPEDEVEGIEGTYTQPTCTVFGKASKKLTRGNLI